MQVGMVFCILTYTILDDVGAAVFAGVNMYVGKNVGTCPDWHAVWVGKALGAIDLVIPVFQLMQVKEQPENANGEICKTLSGIVTVFKDKQPQNIP